MKRIIYFTLLLLTALSVNAQVKVISPHPDIKVKLLRCKEAGGTATLEFTLTNLSNKDMTIYMWGAEPTRATKVYDDEGNIYDTDEQVSVQIANGPASSYMKCSENTFPSDVPVKCRVFINGLDEYAAELSKVIVDLLVVNGTNKDIEFKNVPIIRD